MLDPVTSFFVALFHTPGAALGLAAVILAFAVGLIVFSHIVDYRPLLLELRDRANMLAATRSKDVLKTFFDDFDSFDTRFSGVSVNAATPAALVLGWANYRSLLVETDGHFATTARAVDAFDKLDEPARSLEWWANIMVAVGLLITFLGIVAALTEATAAMSQSGADTSTVQTAILGLLTIAATKFWTSIAGVLASIILRLVARQRRRRIESMEAGFFARLDACVQFMPPEKVMVQQLQSLRHIETALAGGSTKAATK